MAWEATDLLQSPTKTANDRFGCGVATWDEWLAVIALGPGTENDNVHFHKWGGTGWVWKQTEIVTGLRGNVAIEVDIGGPPIAMYGDWCVVGAGDYNNDQGRIYIFYNDNGVWKTKPSWAIQSSDIGADDNFGWAVAIWDKTILAGAPNKGNGAVYAIVRSGEGLNATFSEQQKLTQSDGTGSDSFGTACGLYQNTAVIGAPLHNHDGDTFPDGSAYVLDRSGVTWSETKELRIITPNWFDRFGRACAIWDTHIVVGAIEDDTRGTNAGALFAHEKSGGVWPETGNIVYGSGVASNWGFGRSVAIYGNNMIAGGYGSGKPKGYAYRFRFVSSWVQAEDIIEIPTAGNDTKFGSFAAMGNNKLAVACPWYNLPTANTGAVLCKFTTEDSYPAIVRLIPYDGEEDVEKDTDVRFSIISDSFQINIKSLLVWIDGELIYRGSSDWFASGWNRSSYTANDEFGFDFVLRPDRFRYFKHGEEVNPVAYGEDIHEISVKRPWSFTIDDLPFLRIYPFIIKSIKDRDELG